LMQAASDVLLGWGRTTIDGMERDFYVRQLRDWKGSFVIDEMVPGGLSLYGRMCGWTLARAHARSGDRVVIASYLGTNHSIEEAIATFAAAYADQNDHDYDALVRAVRDGRIHAETEGT
jgi:predicted alpha/beta hydrolase